MEQLQFSNTYPNPFCKSFFKEGKNAMSKEKFTKVWAEMITKIEKKK